MNSNTDKSSLIDDVASSLLNVLQFGLLIFFFFALPIGNDDIAQLKLYLICFLAFISIIHLFLTKSLNIYWKLSNDRFFIICLAGLLIMSLISFALAPNQVSSLVGGVGYRLGYLSFICAIFIGLSAQHIINRRNLTIYYFGSLVMLFVSGYYHFAMEHQSARLFWPIALSNNFALLLATAFIIGLYIINSSNWRLYSICQLVFLMGIFLTQSRAVIFLTFVCGGAYVLFFRKLNIRFVRKVVKYWLFYFGIGLLIMASILFNIPRLRSGAYFVQSLDYRVALQKRGFEMLSLSPLYGMGPDAIQHVFNNGHNGNAQVIKTIRQGYKFFSVHNVFLDKFIEYGIPAGLLLVFLSVWALIRGWIDKTKAVSAVVLAIFTTLVLYGLIDFFSIETMVIFWLGLCFLSIRSLTYSYTDDRMVINSNTKDINAYKKNNQKENKPQESEGKY